MDRIAPSAFPSTPRRFILVPEETALAGSPRIRRYQLSSVGQGARPGRTVPAGVDPARALGPHGLARLEGA